MMARLAISLGVALALLTAPRAGAAEGLDLRAGAWDRSVLLEREGKLEEARRLLQDAFGPETPSYEVTVRVAWLSLRLGDAERAVSGYQRARGLAGAGPESSEGLASALTMMGHRHLAGGEHDEARRAWESAQKAFPDHAGAREALAAIERRAILAPEVWGGYLHRVATGRDSRGWVVVGQLPWHVTREITLRATYRHAEMVTKSGYVGLGGLGALGALGSSTRWLQHDLLLGARYEGRWFGGELLGGALLPSQEGAVGLGGARLRVGRWFGADIEGSLLHRDAGWSGQVLPRLYVSPIPALGLAAGARFTRDGDGTAVSGVAGVSVFAGPAALSLSGHVGPERWPVSVSVPLVFGNGEDLTLGGSLTAMFRVAEALSLGVSTQVERFSDSTGSTGVYVNVSAGAQFAPRW